jgi:ankyrin repeat protein
MQSSTGGILEKSSKASRGKIHSMYKSKANLEVQKTTTHPSDPELLDIIVRYGNNPLGIPMLHYAIVQKDHKAVDILLKHGASPLTKDHIGRGCLYYAILADDLTLTKKFIELGIDPNETCGYTDRAGEDGLSPLCFAIKEHRNTIAKFLIESGVRQDIGFYDDCQYPVTFACCTFGNYEMLSYLLDRGAGIETKLEFQGQSLNMPRVLYHLLSRTGEKMDLRAQENKMLCLELLLRKKLIQMPTDPNAYWSSVIINSYPLAVTYLLDNHYISPNQTFGTKENPSHILAHLAMDQFFGLEYVNILISRGVDVNAREGVHGWNVAHYLTGYDRLENERLAQIEEILEILLRNRLDINARDKYGRTALEMANMRSDKRLAEWLKSKGATS